MNMFKFIDTDEYIDSNNNNNIKNKLNRKQKKENYNGNGNNIGNNLFNNFLMDYNKINGGNYQYKNGNKNNLETKSDNNNLDSEMSLTEANKNNFVFNIKVLNKRNNE